MRVYCGFCLKIKVINIFILFLFGRDGKSYVLKEYIYLLLLIGGKKLIFNKKFAVPM